MEVTLHEQNFANQHQQRVSEWRRALQELSHESAIRPKKETQNPKLEIISRGDLGFTFRLHSDGEIPVNVDVRKRHMQPYFDSYKEVIEHLLKPQHSTYGFEALDYGKKLAHDEAAEFLQSALRDHLEIEHATARRLFTLLFLLGNDIPWAHVRMHPTY
jgi:uncharacterized protein (UPF0262 family)